MNNQTSGFIQVVGQSPMSPATTAWESNTVTNPNNISNSGGSLNQPASLQPAPCPSCGHCPTCGRGGHYAPTYYQPTIRPY